MGARRKFEFERAPKPKRVGPPRDTTKLVQARAEKVNRALDRWQKRLIVAQRRVAKLTQQSRYYSSELLRRATERRATERSRHSDAAVAPIAAQ